MPNPTPVIGTPITVASSDLYQQRLHFFEAGFRWIEKFDVAAFGGSKPIQALKNRGKALALARRIMLSQQASLQGITYAYAGSGDKKNKAYTTRDPNDGIGPGFAPGTTPDSYEPTFTSLDVDLYDTTFTIRDERNFRGLVSVTANRFAPNGSGVAGSPELDALSAMLTILNANPFTEPVTGMTVVYGIRSSLFVPQSVVSPEPVTLSCTTDGHLVLTTTPGNIIACGPPSAPVGIAPGQYLKLRGNRTGCFKGINGKMRVLSVNTNADATESYLVDKVSCCGCAALACWTGHAWCVPDFLWQYQPYSYPDISGVSKRDTGIFGLGTRRGRRRNCCRRPAPVAF